MGLLVGGARHARACTAVLVVPLLALVAGCGGADSAPETGPGSPTLTAVPSPITVDAATSALRKHGFSAAAVERSCGLQTISAMLTNATAGWAALRREGALNCFLLVEPGGNARDAVRGDTAAASAERRLANLKCDLYGRRQLGFAALVDRLDRAFADLAAALP